MHLQNLWMEEEQERGKERWALTVYLTGKEPCPQWTRRQIWYGRSFSCSCEWPWCRRTAQRPPWWAALWRSLADRRQTRSYTLEGAPLWLEGEGLFKRRGTKAKAFSIVPESRREADTLGKVACRNFSKNDSDVPESGNAVPEMNYDIFTRVLKTMLNNSLSKWQKAHCFD